MNWVPGDQLTALIIEPLGNKEEAYVELRGAEVESVVLIPCRVLLKAAHEVSEAMLDIMEAAPAVDRISIEVPR